MTSRVPASQSFFGWLDYDERDAQRMREVFAAFDDKDTVDSLGLGVIRDSISDQLFPGISTIQTRARYFFFVPWICQILEAEAVPPGRFIARLKDLEVALIESLRKMEGSSQGVIGYWARRSLTRFPSTVYWNGLKVFGIRQLTLSLADYRGALPRLAALQAGLARDDDGDLVTAPQRMWDRDLPRPPIGFPFEPISIALTGEESDYLTGKIIEQCPDTLLSELASDSSTPRTATAPWRVPLPSPSARVSDVLHHSRNFSEVMEGAQALYNLLLARRAQRSLGRDTTTLQESLVSEIDKWSALMKSRNDELVNWIAGEDFWHFVERSTPVPSATRRFVLAWVKQALRDPGGVASRPDAEAMIVEREFRLKGKLARLSEQRALENWNGDPFSVGQMTFRWSNARQILDDLQNDKRA